jgi:DNA-binding FadR family transcriptional regulator
MALTKNDRNEIRIMILEELDSLLRENSFSVFRERTLNSQADGLHKKIFEDIVRREKDALAQRGSDTLSDE